MEGEVAIRIEDRPCVPAHVNGAGPFWLVLDTGCAGSFVSRAVGDSLGLEADADGVTCLAEMRIGSARWRDVRFGVEDDPAFLSLPGPQVHDFLKHFRVTLDYAGRAIRLEQGGARA